MMKMERDAPSWSEWLSSELKDGDKVGLDYSQYPIENLEARKKTFKEKGITVEKSENLVDLVWGDERPSRP